MACVSGALGVILGAFGAHGLEKKLETLGHLDTWETAVFYHFVHSIALLCLGLMKKPNRWSAYCFGLGILLFSGSLYILSVTDLKMLGMVAPIGGTSLIAGWVLMGQSEIR